RRPALGAGNDFWVDLFDADERLPRSQNPVAGKMVSITGVRWKTRLQSHWKEFLQRILKKELWLALTSLGRRNWENFSKQRMIGICWLPFQYWPLVQPYR
ncbi:hypothetical protein SOVF_139170, partial [Spinacia oleracea]